MSFLETLGLMTTASIMIFVMVFIILSLDFDVLRAMTNQMFFKKFIEAKIAEEEEYEKNNPPEMIPFPFGFQQMMSQVKQEEPKENQVDLFYNNEYGEELTKELTALWTDSLPMLNRLATSFASIFPDRPSSFTKPQVFDMISGLPSEKKELDVFADKMIEIGCKHNIAFMALIDYYLTRFNMSEAIGIPMTISGEALVIQKNKALLKKDSDQTWLTKMATPELVLGLAYARANDEYDLIRLLDSSMYQRLQSKYKISDGVFRELMGVRARAQSILANQNKPGGKESTITKQLEEIVSCVGKWNNAFINLYK